jgi:hypothetical protein
LCGHDQRMTRRRATTTTTRRVRVTKRTSEHHIHSPACFRGHTQHEIPLQARYKARVPISSSACMQDTKSESPCYMIGSARRR